MKEARENDRKMIDQLRAAGGDGADAVFAKNMKEEVTKYKENLREAREEVSKAVKKQREAEEQRAAIENSKKKELDDLSSKFDKLKEKVKPQTADPGSPTPNVTSGGDSPHLERLRHRLTHAESEVDTLRGRNGALEQEVASLKELLATTSATGKASSAGAISDTESSGGEKQVSGAVDVGTGEKLRALQVDLVSMKSELSTTQGQLKREQADLAESRSAEAAAKEEARRQEAALNRKIEDLEWEGVEVEKKLAEVRLQLEGNFARCATLENRLDAKESERSLLEKDLRRSIRDLEDNLSTERQALAEVKREFQGKETTLHSEMTRALEQAAKTNALVGEAEEQHSKSAEQLEDQRRRYEEHIGAMERQVREADATRARLEGMIYELREETRHRDDVIEDLRQELDTNTQRTQDLEQLQVHQTRSLTNREEELLTRERERQKLRQEVSEKEEEVARLQAERRSQEEVGLKHRKEKERLESGLAEATFTVEKLQAEQTSQARLLTERARGLEMTELKMTGLEKDLAEERRLHMDTKATLDRELTKANQRTSVEESGGNTKVVAENTAGGASIPATFAATPVAATVAPPPTKTDRVDPIAAASAAFTQSRTGRGRYVGAPAAISAFPGERGESGSVAMTLKRLTWSQWRLIIAAAVFFVLILSLVNSTHGTGQPTRFDTENMFNVREKYEQALASLGACREQLKTKVAGTGATTGA